MSDTLGFYESSPRAIAERRLRDALANDKDLQVASTAKLFDDSLRESYEAIATLRARIKELEQQIDGAAKSCKEFRLAVAGEKLPAGVMFKLTEPFMHLEGKLRRPTALKLVKP